MQNVSELYNEIISQDNHWFETSLAIGESGLLITQSGDTIVFGGDRILVDMGNAESGFREGQLMSVSTSHAVFNKDYPTVGSAVSGEINVQMFRPINDVPKMARLALFVRATDGVRFSEWLPKGIYYIDTRETSHNSNDLDIMTIHGYDAMLMFEVDYPSDSVNSYPLLDTTMVKFLADSIGIDVDPRTYERMDKGYTFPLPVGYSSREVLGIIASSYGGNFIISDEGNLLLIRLSDLPKENNYLIDQVGDVLVFGADIPGSESEFSGDIVTFDNPGGAEITALSIAVEPVQAGSGDPSPDNVRPISGWDAVGIWNKPTHDTTTDPTVTIQLGQTVYGGMLDVTGGTMTVDRVCTTESSSTGWTVSTGEERAFKNFPDIRTHPSSSTPSPFVLSNYLPTISFTNGYTSKQQGIFIGANSKNVCVHIDGVTNVSAAAFNTYLSEHPLQICYTLATPIEITLTPTQIDTIAGQNNIWSNSGNIEATVQFSGGEAVKILV